MILILDDRTDRRTNGDDWKDPCFIDAQICQLLGLWVFKILPQALRGQAGALQQLLLVLSRDVAMLPRSEQRLLEL